jgi:hypothetical protein
MFSSRFWTRTVCSLRSHVLASLEPSCSDLCAAFLACPRLWSGSIRHFSSLKEKELACPRPGEVGPFFVLAAFLACPRLWSGSIRHFSSLKEKELACPRPGEVGPTESSSGQGSNTRLWGRWPSGPFVHSIEYPDVLGTNGPGSAQ